MSINFMRRQRGLSLIELIIFIVVVGIAAVALLKVMGFFTAKSADPVRRKQALLLAESYLEEVELARFTYCDPTDAQAATATAAVVGPNGCIDLAHVEDIGQEPVAGASGRPYDNVSDYATVKDVPQENFKNASGNLSDVNGTTIDSSRLAGYTVTVMLSIVPAVSPLGPATKAITSSGPGTPGNLNALRITVQVKYGSGSPAETVTLDGYRTRYAPRSVP